MLPMNMDEVTTPWLERALSKTWPGIRISDMSIDLVTHGAATRARVSFSHEWSGAGATPPPSVWLKTGFEPHHDYCFPYYRAEVQFYDRLAGLLPVRMPECYVAAVQDDPPQATLLLEDLTLSASRFCTPLEPLTVAQASTGLEQLAILHSFPVEKLAEVGLPPALAGINTISGFLAEGDALVQSQRALDGTAAFRDLDLIANGLRRLLDVFDRSAPRSLVHGDSHVGNSYLNNRDEICFLDWQGYGLGTYLLDLPYFLTGALEINDRRAAEKDLIGFYLARRNEISGTSLNFADIWDDYRRATFYGFLMWLGNHDEWQPPAVNAAQHERFNAAMVDHDTIALLGLS